MFMAGFGVFTQAVQVVFRGVSRQAVQGVVQAPCVRFRAGSGGSGVPLGLVWI